MIIAVAGCVAQAEGAEIMKRAPYVDMVFGPQSYHQLPEMVAQATRGVGHILEKDFPIEPKFDYLPEEAIEVANQKLARINAAYDEIAKARGIR